MAERSLHPDVVDLSEYAEGLLDPTRQSAVEQHVRDCAECTRTLADLAGLPETLAKASLPPLPAEVADRLDRAIAAESSARASAASEPPDSTVVPMRRKRRWLAPALAAAAVLGVIGIAVPVLDSRPGDDSASSSSDSGDAAREFVKGGQRRSLSGPSDTAAEGRGVPDLSSATFGRDVADTFFPDQRKRMLPGNPLASQTDGELHYRDAVEGLCPAPADVELPGGWVVAITLDGEPAHLLISQPGPATDVVAFTCDGSDARVLATATLANP
jgi:hypothetical protein